MRNRCSIALMVCVGLAGLAAFAPPAGANRKPKSKHFRMLAFRPCNSVLVASDFFDDLQEVLPKSVTSASGTSFGVSSCKYASTEKELSVVSPAEFTKGGIGLECIHNILRLEEKGIEAPPGGCYRFASATVQFAYGRAVERLASKLQKGARSPNWRPGFGRYVLSGVGNRAEFGYDSATGDGYGYLQVDNATLLVETSEGANPSLIKLLRDAAASL
ncbi:MAG: hypothetical protein ABSG93_18730 [Solirubrobacteraceae bacterium]|jgi:hypothetical protein